jgi:hypothetical protein
MPLIFYRLLAMYLGVVVDFGTLFHTNQELCVAQFEMGLKGSHLCASWAGLIGPTIRGRSSKWTAYNSSQSIKGWIGTLTLIRFLSYLPYLLSGSQRKREVVVLALGPMPAPEQGGPEALACTRRRRNLAITSNGGWVAFVSLGAADAPTTQHIIVLVFLCKCLFKAK